MILVFSQSATLGARTNSRVLHVQRDCLIVIPEAPEDTYACLEVEQRGTDLYGAARASLWYNQDQSESFGALWENDKRVRP